MRVRVGWGTSLVTPPRYRTLTPMAASKTARWLDLIAFLLQHRYPVLREEIFRRVRGYGVDVDEGTDRQLESARRKFERDKDELRALGIAIETLPVPGHADDEAGSAYRLKAAGFYLPYFELGDTTAPAARPYAGLRHIPLTPSDLRILDRATRRLAEREEFPLAEAARSLRQKLAFDLPLAEAAVERVLSDPLPPEAHASLAVLQQAVAARRAVRCTYYTIHRDDEGVRELEPWGLFFERSHWYVVARPRDRAEPRVFRVDRMRNATPLRGAEGTFTVPASFDVRGYLGRHPWELSDDPARRVRVRFGFPQSRWVLNAGSGTAVEPVLDDGGAIIEFDVREPGAFLRWLLTFRRQAAILDPAELASELDAMRARVAGLYER